ncbi:Uu.00g026780.m01.CDS01 [Anthostomella pinea]|uniref:Uu.00g026780.m01.CDS01 n=1 Tax=Anthostomella pinea TaxID=933095 RepID=A0AAI8V8L5_9PEZI|nr:Uu.00g026780.m01.CDS01 [Anthostomella pinea]
MRSYIAICIIIFSNFSLLLLNAAEKFSNDSRSGSSNTNDTYYGYTRDEATNYYPSLKNSMRMNLDIGTSILNLFEIIMSLLGKGKLSPIVLCVTAAVKTTAWFILRILGTRANLQLRTVLVNTFVGFAIWLLSLLQLGLAAYVGHEVRKGRLPRKTPEDNGNDMGLRDKHLNQDSGRQSVGELEYCFCNTTSISRPSKNPKNLPCPSFPHLPTMELMYARLITPSNIGIITIYLATTLVLLALPHRERIAQLIHMHLMDDIMILREALYMIGIDIYPWLIPAAAAACCVGVCVLVWYLPLGLAGSCLVGFFLVTLVVLLVALPAWMFWECWHADMKERRRQVRKAYGHIRFMRRLVEGPDWPTQTPWKQIFWLADASYRNLGGNWMEDIVTDFGLAAYGAPATYREAQLATVTMFRERLGDYIEMVEA